MQVDLDPNQEQQSPSPQIFEHTDARHHVFSFIQTRGSSACFVLTLAAPVLWLTSLTVPLFWSQSPWALKPVPVLERSEGENSSVLHVPFESVTAKLTTVQRRSQSTSSCSKRPMANSSSST